MTVKLCSIPHITSSLLLHPSLRRRVQWVKLSDGTVLTSQLACTTATASSIMASLIFTENAEGRHTISIAWDEEIQLQEEAIHIFLDTPLPQNMAVSVTYTHKKLLDINKWQGLGLGLVHRGLKSDLWVRLCNGHTGGRPQAGLHTHWTLPWKNKALATEV